MRATEHDEYILFSYSVFFVLTWLYCDIDIKSVYKLLSYNPRLNLHMSSRSGTARTKSGKEERENWGSILRNIRQA